MSVGDRVVVSRTMSGEVEGYCSERTISQAWSTEWLIWWMWRRISPGRLMSSRSSELPKMIPSLLFRLWRAVSSLVCIVYREL